MTRVLAVLVGAGLLAGCSAQPAQEQEDGTLSGTVTVFAAASLTDTFGAIADAFEREHPGVAVALNFGGSSALATQIVEGAPADVFAAASESTMTPVADAALVDGDPTVFVTNTLEIAVPAGNPAGVTGLSDFANPALSIAICAAEVPCGAASATVFDGAGIVPAPDTLEQDVKAVLTKVELGEVDAGLVYRTDVLAAGPEVDGIAFPEASTALGKYPIAQLAASTNQDAAAAFIAYVLSPAGKKVLDDAGFGTP
ncbi:molybdate transport system substrate-binding protein [Salinibacterium sp. CAN_S4]|uniref:molybdate ABC transporter substrate-binding protein n=1 Tax=Salinibacterium sp. CAN_S4 TaxID=2787727 RepID=UPI0018EF9133